MKPDPRLESLLSAAREHGEEGDPDHEVGDLTDLVIACWARLTPAQRDEVYTEIRAARD